MKIDISDFEGIVSLDQLSIFLHSVLPKPQCLKINYPSGFVQMIDLDAFNLPEYQLLHNLPVVVQRGEKLIIEVKE